MEPSAFLKVIRLHECNNEVVVDSDFFESRPAGVEFTSKNKEQSNSGTQRFERTMKPLFVSNKDGLRVVHWKKLTAFSVAAMVLTAVLVEGLWWLAVEHSEPRCPDRRLGARRADRGPHGRPGRNLPRAGTRGDRGFDMTTR